MMHSMSPARLHSALPHARFEHFILIATLFWALAYAVLTVHATLDPASSGRLLSEGRLLATATGAALLLGILLMWERLARVESLIRVKMVTLAIGGACVVMYGVRLLAAAWFGDYGTTEMADGGRWVIAWAGYFLAAVSTTVAWQATREAERLRAGYTYANDYECADDLYNSVR